jgi:hypothetical protein
MNRSSSLTCSTFIGLQIHGFDSSQGTATKRIFYRMSLAVCYRIPLAFRSRFGTAMLATILAGTVNVVA